MDEIAAWDHFKQNNVARLRLIDERKRSQRRADCFDELVEALQAVMEKQEFDNDSGKWGVRVVPSAKALDKAHAILAKVEGL